MCFYGCNKECCPPHSKWNPKYILASCAWCQCRLIRTHMEDKNTIKSYAFREADSVIWIFRHWQANWERDLQRCPPHVETPCSAPSVPAALRGRSVPVSCKAHSSRAASELTMLKFSAPRRWDSRPGWWSTPGRLTPATRHVSFTMGWPNAAVSHQPARLLQHNDTPSFIPPTFLHTRTFRVHEVEKGKLQIFICQLCTFSPFPPFHKKQLFYSQEGMGGGSLLFFYFR